MPAIIRNTGPRGPRFFEDNGTLRFVNVVDASTRDGPRDATDEDRIAHPEAFAALGSSAHDMFPGAKPMVTFSGEPPPELANKPPLAVPAPPREEPKPPKRETLSLKTAEA
jgi:hypothetical protein